MSPQNEKIRNYNQGLLAVGGTLALLFAVIMGIVVLWSMFGPRTNRNSSPQGIIATEKTEALLQDSLRKQIISFSTFHLIDSTNQIYILPVSQSNLQNKESIDELRWTSGSGYGYQKGRKYYNSKDQTSNNLVLYDALQDKSEIIFDDRINITNYQVIEKDNQKYILITGTDTDSNNDNYLNRKDLQLLYVYELSNQSLSKIRASENFTTHSIQVFRDSNKKATDIVGHFGLDRNKNGEFNLGREPMIFQKINLQNKTLEPIIEEEQIAKLQQLLEGSRE